jgi:thiosulfate reductase cytochrome b subunit
MILSGSQIHNAYPILPFAIPAWMTLGGWLEGALLWHFAAMWVRRMV